MIPEHPLSLVLQNKFYPSGLTQNDIWNYYQRVRHLFLPQLHNREIMIMFSIDTNKFIIKRKIKNSPIKINSLKDYDKIISGRTVSIHTAMNSYETFGIIDIDCEIFDRSKMAAIDVVEYFSKFINPKNIRVRFTGKTGFHVLIDLNKKMKIDQIRLLLKTKLLESGLHRRYTIAGKRESGIPNLDLAPDKYRGNFIALHSLSVLGLRCIEVPFSQIRNFRKGSAKIGRR